MSMSMSSRYSSIEVKLIIPIPIPITRAEFRHDLLNLRSKSDNQKLTLRKGLDNSILPDIKLFPAMGSVKWPHETVLVHFPTVN
jgi:hypothetical protein